MNERRIWSAPRGVLIDNYRNAYTTHGAVDRLNRLEAELAAAITRAETAEAERDSLATRVDQLEQCAVNTQDPESPLTWEGMQLIAVEKAAECKRIAVERDALAAKLSNIRDNISLIGELVCPSGHGSIECPDIDPLMCEYVCKCGDVLHEHTADIAVSNIRAILEVTP